MKKLIYLTATSFVILFSSCLDTEEKISINNDGSGTYVMTMDMAKMMSMLSAFGGDEKKQEKKDTVIYFKDFTDTSTTLTAEEKEMLHDGKAAINMDSENGVFKIELDAAFKNYDQLAYLRNNFQSMIEKTKAMDKLEPKKQTQEADSTMLLPQPKINAGKAGSNPFKEYFEFKVSARSIEYRVKDKAAAMKAMNENEDLQTIKKMAPMMGDMTFASVIELPHAAKKVEGLNAKLSPDKKTVTIKTTLNDIIKNLDAMAFRVEY